jgi:predicted metal-dependent hydrolase
MNNHLRKKKPEEIETDPLREISLSPENRTGLEHGVRLFNSGKFWHAHEAWELVWQRITDDERLFFQGLIQLAAAYHHLARKQNRTGFVNNLRKAGEKLRVFAPRYLGVDVTPLLAAIDAGIDAAGKTGRKDLAGLDTGLIPRISFHLHFHPDLTAAVRAVTETQEFADGLNHFNDGYFWEAHEMWEEAGRKSEADGKAFVEGFVQAAGGINFLKSAKMDMAAYLLVKSLENLRQFDEMKSRVDFTGLIGWISDHIITDANGKATVKKPTIPVPRLRLTGDGQGEERGTTS